LVIGWIFLTVALLARSDAYLLEKQHLKAGEYVIVAVDRSRTALTLRAGDDLTTMNVRPDTEIRINGEEKAFKDLAPHMKVKVTLAEPGATARIDATGIPEKYGSDLHEGGHPLGRPEPAATNPPTDTESPLAQTTWTWQEGSEVVGNLQLLDGGAAIYSSVIHKGHWRWRWAVIGPTEIRITTNEKKHMVLEFNPTAPQFSSADDGGGSGQLVKPGEPEPR